MVTVFVDSLVLFMLLFEADLPGAPPGITQSPLSHSRTFRGEEGEHSRYVLALAAWALGLGGGMQHQMLELISAF